MRYNQVSTAAIAAAIGLAATGQAAHAQDYDANNQAAVPADADGSATAQSSTQSVPLPAQASTPSVDASTEIVVTARKRTESVQDVPIAISVVSGAALKEQNISEVGALQQVVSGLIIRTTPNNLINLTLRGLGTGTAIDSFEQSVATFIDGTYSGRGPEFNAALFDFDRVEVVRGAQASLLSKNTSLGAISLTTRKPGDEFSVNGSVNYEFELGSTTLEAGMDLPVSENVAVRVAGKYLDGGGISRNVFFNKDSGRTESIAGRIIAEYDAPTGPDATLMYQYFDYESTGVPWELLSDPSGNAERLYNLQPVPGYAFETDFDRTIFNGSAFGEDKDKTKGHRVVGTVNFPLGGGFDITSLTSYSQFDNDKYRDTDLLPGDYLPTWYYQANRQFQQEVRLSSPVDESQFIDYVVGASYFWEKYLFQNDVDSRCFGCPPTVLGPGRFALRGRIATDFDQRTEDLAAFGQANLRFTDQISVSAGVRYTHTNRKATISRDVLRGGALPTVLYQGFGPQDLKIKEDNVDGSLALNFKPNSDLLFYGSVSKGTKGGGFNNNTTTAVTQADKEATKYGKEKAWTYELGGKYSFFGGFFNVTLFQTDIEGFQQAIFDGTRFNITGLDLRSRGVDAEASYEPIEGLQFRGQVTYADTGPKDKSLPDPQGAPKWSGNAAVTYTAPISADVDLVTNVNTDFRSSILLNPRPDIPRSDGYAYLNGRIGLRSQDGWELSLIGKNLTDVLRAEYAVPHTFVASGYYVIPNRPRTIAVQFSYEM